MALQNGFLPDWIEPVHYTLRISKIQAQDEPRGFAGHVEIDLLVKRRTRTISLDAHQLSNIRASLNGMDVVDISVDKVMQRVHLHLAQDLQIGPCKLEMTYDGIIGDEVGFYKSGEILCTQFQPVDARRAFPHFDEPRFKATFELAIEVERGKTVLSNMPIASRRRSDHDPLVDVVLFQCSPKMSSYLLAWAVGELDYIEATVQQTTSSFPVRVYALPNEVHNASFALETATQVLKLFSTMFGVDYPLSKADLLAVPEMTDDAMENWGLCIFRSTTLLLEGNPTSNPTNANRIAYIIAHELAHQWFGNLVTPSTWDELWLNEGFATWAGWHACNVLHPDWQIWPQFIQESMNEAFELDSMRSSHPVQVHVPNGLEVNAIFDSISYLKGASIIRMLAAYLGEEVFIRGVSTYLQSKAYQSATGADLWRALERESSKEVAVVMESWIRQVGFPLLKVEILEGNHARLAQTRFAQADSTTLWWVPIVAQTEAGQFEISLDTQSSSLDLSNKVVTLNHFNTGFYRTLYPLTHLGHLGDRLADLAPHDRLGLLYDTFAIMYTGQGYSIGTFLSLAARLKDESMYTVWSGVLHCLGILERLFANQDALARGLQRFKASLLHNQLEKTTWTPSADDSYNQASLRPLILLEAGLAGNQQIIQKACTHFDSGIEQLPLPLQNAVSAIAARIRGQEALERLIVRYDSTTNTHVRDICVEAMGYLGSSDLVTQCLTTAFQGTIASQDLVTLATSIADNSRYSTTMWAFIRTNWDTVYCRLGDSIDNLGRFLSHALRSMSDRERKDEVVAFFESRDTTGYLRGINVAIDMITANIAFKELSGKGLEIWLRDNGYMG